MAHSIPANEYYEVPGSRIADVRPVCVHDFIEQDLGRAELSALRRTCLADDSRYEPPESQVDRLISDLMDIIVKASSNEAPVPDCQSDDGVAEVVALSMMQALLQKQVCSSY
ncbi:MAG: hypothetical protein F8N37_18385 [Telmatospirillum sp.]|nr:hypothetical protein [Telmatospirillum sp.]